MKIITMAMLQYVEDVITGEKNFSIQFLGINDALVSQLEHDWTEIANEKLKDASNKIEKLKILDATLFKEINELTQELQASKKWFRKYNEKEKVLIETIERKKHELNDVRKEIDLLMLDTSFAANELLDKARNFMLKHGFSCITTSTSTGQKIIKEEVWQTLDL